MEAYEEHIGESAKGRQEIQEIDEMSEEWAGRLVSFLPSRKIKGTGKQLRAILADILRRYLCANLSKDAIQRRVQIATYGRLIKNIGSSRGVVLKLIQLASYLDPELPSELRDCLHHLQDATVAMSAGTVARVIYEEFGKRPAQLFSEWIPEPIAKASIGQVHRARLRSGEWVAVKIQYPEIRRELEAAFDDPVIRDLLATLIRAKSDVLIDDFKGRVLQECDYVLEAENQEKFCHFFAGDPGIRIPRIFPEFCSGKVLTTEFVEAQSFRDFSKTATQDMRNRMGEMIVHFQGVTFFKNHTIYADIHPRNLLFSGDQLVVLDFGRVIDCSERPETWIQLKNMLVAILNNDPEAGRQVVRSLEMVSDWKQFDYDLFWQLVREQHSHFWHDKPFVFSRDYLARKNRLMRSFAGRGLIHIKGPAFWNHFVVSTHDAVRAELGATTNWRRAILKEIGDSGVR